MGGKDLSPGFWEDGGINQELEDTPELVNESPYEKGWMFKVTASNLQEELKGLMQIENLGVYQVRGCWRPGPQEVTERGAF